MALTFIVIGLYIFGLLLIATKKRVMHAVFMGAAIALDLSLTIYLVLESHVLAKAIGERAIQVSAGLLWTHIVVALLTVACYCVMIPTGLRQLRRPAGGEVAAHVRRRARHRRWAFLTMAFYLATVFTIPTQTSVASWFLALVSA